MGKYDVGTIHRNKIGEEFEIINKIGYEKRLIKFLDGNNYTKEVHISHINKGSIENKYNKSLYGIGFMGDGSFTSKTDNKINKLYNTWSMMFTRCYNKDKRPSYKNVAVCEEWHNFQNFGKWYEENYPKHIENIRFELDKDLLSNGESKIYSPKNCVFLPSTVNSFISTNIQSRNSSEVVGASYHKASNKWRATIRDFEFKKCIHLGTFKTVLEAGECYNNHRKVQAEKVKDYLRNLNYLPEHIIQLIK